MSTPHEISVSWPPLPLSEAGWRTRLEDLAAKAESLVGRPCSLQDTAELGLELVGLVWQALGPETVAATARASLLLNTPVLMATAPVDQVQEVADRLDEIWQQAQQHPGAGVVTLPPPLLQQVVPSPSPRTPRKPKLAALEVIEPEPAAVPLPEPPEPTRTPPPGWWPAADVGELLGLSRSAVCRRRNAGALGEEGTGWLRCGKTYHYSPESVAALEGEMQAEQKKDPPTNAKGLRTDNPQPA